MSFLKWFYPGMGIKRWLLLAFLGLLIFAHGILLLGNLRLESYTGFLDNYAGLAFNYTNRIFSWSIANHVSIPLLYTTMIGVGLLLILFGTWQWMRSIVNAITPSGSDSLVNLVYQQRSLRRGLRIVAIGGGTGLSTLLGGIKEYTSNIVGVVTVTDDGGSSGRLRKELGVLPPGDIRNCLVALADSEVLGDLLQYRFEEGNGLEGHSFGNLFLVAMTGISGNFLQAVKDMSRVLAIRGQVLPSTSLLISLCAELEDGRVIQGETEVTQNGKSIRRLFSRPPRPKPLDEVIEAIKEADAVVLGPGSLYTSIMPNLLVAQMVEAIRTTQAVKLFICNCMTQPGETDNLTASGHLKAFETQFGKGLVEFALVNTARPGNRILQKYRETGSDFVEPDTSEIEAMGITPIPLPLISETAVVRHDPKRLSEAVMKVILEGFSREAQPAPEKTSENVTAEIS